jgi:hypothetical protein
MGSRTKDAVAKAYVPPCSIIKVIHKDMPSELQERATEVIERCFGMTIIEGHIFSGIAAHIREEFDKEFDGPGWNCVIGSSFGSRVTFHVQTYM